MSEDVLPLTVLIPETGSDPIDVYDQHAALRMAVIEREGVFALRAEWDVPGVYILLDPPDHDGSWGVYVGKAPAGIASRLSQHFRGKEGWHRALLVRRDTTFGFNSAQIGWLEGRLYDLFDAAENAHLNNGVRPIDETLPPYDRQMLELVVLPITRLLRLIGHDPATPDEGLPPTRGRRSNRFFGITILQLLDHGLLSPNCKLVSTNGAWPATAELSADGSIAYEGTTYDSPSKAAVAVKQGAASNGWEFWAVETESGRIPLATLRARFLDHQSKDVTPGDPSNGRF